MVSGQHDTWPMSLRPRAFARAMASRSPNTAFGLTLLCSSAATITGLPLLVASDSRNVMRVWLPLVSMYTPRPDSPIASTSAAISRSSARRDGIGRPPSPLCAGLVLLANPTAPERMASRTIACICAISSSDAARVDASAPIT